MEQQTISLTKAGVKATLNARASILAAANPIGGRYDKKKTLKHNINLTAPIMSRFDLFFILVDDCIETVDYAIARKIVDIHGGVEIPVARSPYTIEEVQRYICFARQFKPKISSEAQKYMVGEYRRLRQRDCVSGSKSSFRITVRQLESMVRLSEAMARLFITDYVKPVHVKEAFRLLSKVGCFVRLSLASSFMFLVQNFSQICQKLKPKCGVRYVTEVSINMPYYFCD